VADLTDDIISNVNAPRSVTADGTAATGTPTADLILADQYVNGKAAMRKRGRGLRFTKLVFGGQVSGVPGAGGFNGLV
jgi:hypothetical protein